MRRPSWTVVLTAAEGFVAVPIASMTTRIRPMHKQHAIEVAVKLNADELTADLIRQFGPGVEQ
jgi:hypothetical protein